ncbi:MAG: HepT-like ribonuclease domain-containing protein [Thermoplasmata archaeon]
MNGDRTKERLSLATEHFQIAIEYSRRGRATFFDSDTPDTLRLIESELRKAYDSLNRLGDAFYHINPGMPRERIGEVRQSLTHDYSEVDPDELWRLVTDEAPRLLRRLARIRVPR